MGMKTCLVHWKNLTCKQRKSVLKTFILVIILELLDLLHNLKIIPNLFRSKLKDMKTLRMMIMMSGRKLNTRGKGFFRVVKMTMKKKKKSCQKRTKERKGNYRES